MCFKCFEIDRKFYRLTHSFKKRAQILTSFINVHYYEDMPLVAKYPVVQEYILLNACVQIILR